MSCDAERLVAYVLGDLEAEPKQAVEAHLEDCRACAGRLAEFRAAVGLLGALPAPAERPVSMAALRAAIAETESVAARPVARVQNVPRRRRWVAAFAAAAALAVLCFHYGVAVRVGNLEVALGGPGRVTAPAVPSPIAPAMDEQTVRSVVRGEIAAEVAPPLLRLARTVEDLDARQHADLTALQNAVTVQRAADMTEVKRNIGVLASTVDQTLGVR